MAMDPRVTLEVRTSCRTWLGLWVGVGLGQVGDAHLLLSACTTLLYMPLLLPHLDERRLHLGHHHHDLGLGLGTGLGSGLLGLGSGLGKAGLRQGWA